jgi:hypothetical protein
MLERMIHTNTTFACIPIRGASEGEKGLNSEEAERLVWAAQTIFATSCEPPRLSPACTYNYRYYLC